MRFGVEKHQLSPGVILSEDGGWPTRLGGLPLANVAFFSLAAPVNSRPMETQRSLVHSVLTDLHFWIPVLVLIAGLVVLHWIS